MIPLTPTTIIPPEFVQQRRGAFWEALDEYSDPEMTFRIHWMIDRLAKVLLDAGRVSTLELGREYAADVIAECVWKGIEVP